MSKNEFKQPHHRTKIVATVGPACDTYDQLKNLVIAGVNVFRLNFSHGSHEDKKKIIDNIRGINEELGCTVAILGDLQGPKLRVGEIENNRLEVKEGDVLTFTNEKCVGTMEKIYVSYPNLAGDVVVNNLIMIDDGKIEVKVHSVEKNGDVKVKVTLGGIISSKKGINLPDTKISLPALTDKDLEDAAFIIKEELDWVALSFVKRVADIEMLRAILDKHKSKAKIIAKIEMPEALTNIRDIIISSDAIMIARGDLGVELPVEKIPLIQIKSILVALYFMIRYYQKIVLFLAQVVITKKMLLQMLRGFLKELVPNFNSETLCPFLTWRGTIPFFGMAALPFSKTFLFIRLEPSLR